LSSSAFSGGQRVAAASAATCPRVAGWLSHEDPVSFLLHGPGLLRYDRPVRAAFRVAASCWSREDGENIQAVPLPVGDTL